MVLFKIHQRFKGHFFNELRVPLKEHEHGAYAFLYTNINSDRNVSTKGVADT